LSKRHKLHYTTEASSIFNFGFRIFVFILLKLLFEKLIVFILLKLLFEKLIRLSLYFLLELLSEKLSGNVFVYFA